jgi:hypothetical protein
MTGMPHAIVGPVQSGPQSLGVDVPIHGPIWSLVVPALLFVFAAGATYLLYRHFASRESGEDA